MNFRQSVLFGMAIWGMNATSAEATVLVDPGLDQRLLHADAVVIASPLAARASHWNNGRIYTTVGLTIRATLRGPPLAARIDVELPGGQIGDVVQRLEGTPGLIADSTAVVLLRRLASGRYTVLDLSLGVLPVEVTTGGEVRVFAARAEGATVISRSVQSPRQRALLREGEALTSFATWVRGLSP